MLDCQATRRFFANDSDSLRPLSQLAAVLLIPCALQAVPLFRRTLEILQASVPDRLRSFASSLCIKSVGNTRRMEIWRAVQESGLGSEPGTNGAVITAEANVCSHVAPRFLKVT